MARLGLAASALALLLLAAPAGADDGPMLPAYAPVPGTTWTVRSATTLTTTFDGTGAVAAATHTDRLELTHLQQAAETSGGLWREVWTLDVDGGSVAPAPLDGAPADPHAAYRRSMRMWGVDRLEIETDAAGIARQLLGAAAIRAAAEKTMAALVPPGAGTPPSVPILDAFRERPLMLVDVLLPESRALAALQTAAPQPVAAGRTWTAESGDLVAGIALAKKTVFTVDAVDAAARTVTVSWRDDFEAEALSRAFAPLLERNIAAVAAATKAEVPAERRKTLTAVAIDNHGRVTLSLVDGTTRTTEWSRTGRFGDMTTAIETRVTRAPR